MYTNGMNQLGELDCNYYDQKPSTYARLRNRMNFSDYTCYVPVNKAEHLSNPNRWQPAFDWLDNTTWVVQKFALPQVANLATYSGIDVARLVKRLPGPKEWPSAAYTTQAIELLNISIALNDTEKMIAEFFNNKSKALVDTTQHLVLTEFAAGHIHKLPIAVIKSVAIATRLWFDATIFSWKSKVVFDAIRPFSTIKFLFRDSIIRAWSQNQGTQTMRGFEWEPYLVTGPFPEYVSTTTCLTYSLGQGFYRIRGNVSSGWNFLLVFPKGSSGVEPGLTPQTNITYNLATLEDMKLVASLSRTWGGVHFRAASEDPRPICNEIGNSVFNKWVQEMNGDPILDGV